MRLLLIGADGAELKETAKSLPDYGIDARVCVPASLEEFAEMTNLEGIDAVVADLSLPGIGGRAVLRKIQQLAPNILRVASVDPIDEELAIFSINVAHSFLAHPYSSDHLVLTVERLVHVQNRLQKPELKSKIGSITSLPSPPSLCMRIMNALEDPNCHAGLVAELIAEDAVLSGKLLQISNSALYCSGRHMDTVAAAVGRMGLRTVRTLVLAAELFSHGNAGADVTRIQKESLTASWLAGRIATDRVSGDIAATSALLTGLGRIIPELGPEEALLRFETPGIHAEAAAYLLDLWGLPPVLIEPVAVHRCPRFSDYQFGITGAVHVATALARNLPVDEPYLERVGVLKHLDRWSDLAADIAGREAVA